MKGTDLRVDKVCEDLFIEVFMRALRWRWLQRYRRHDQWDELCHFLKSNETYERNDLADLTETSSAKLYGKNEIFLRPSDH